VSALATGEAGYVAVKNGQILASGPYIDQVPYLGGDVTAVGVGYEFAAALHGGAVTVWGADPANYGVLNVPQAAQQPGAIAAISVGYTHILALTTDGHVLSWGDNSYGETTPTTVRATAITAGESVSFAVATNGSVFGWGYGSAAALVPPGAQSHVVSVAVTGEVAAALRDDGTVVSWEAYRGGVVPVPAAAARGILAIGGGAGGAGGEGNVAALRTDGTVIRWNYQGTVSSNPLVTPPGERVVALAASNSFAFGEIQGSTPAGSSPVSAWINGVQECATAWAVGRPVTMYPCVTDPANATWADQQFFPRLTNPSVNQDFRIYSWLYNSCLTPTGLANGASLTLAPCTGAANQSWFKSGVNGTVVVTNRAAGLSIDTAGGSTLTGTRLVIGYSSGTPTQAWTVYPS
jgi:hypothetical protein